MRVAGDQRFVVRKRHSWNIFEQVATVAYRISLETNCVEVSCLIKLHDWGSATSLRKQLPALDMALNTPLNHKLSTYYYNTDVCKDPSDYSSSCPEVFCKKNVLRNFGKFTGKHLCQNLFLNKVAGLRPVFSCESCEISENTFFDWAPLVTASVISSKWTA